MNSDKPAGICWQNLYIHIPYCAGKCGYCAFYSEGAGTRESRRRYLEKVVSTLKDQQFIHPVETLYIGGGTPNLLTWQEMEFLFQQITDIVPLSGDCEISCELNPELLTACKMDLLNTYVDRLSLGVQSFDPQVRGRLMRKCSQEHLCQALKLLEKRSAVHFNIDLIYGIAGVDWRIFANDIEQAVQAGVDHLSCYALTAEENSLLGLSSPVTDDESAADWWLKIGETLAAKGFLRYEISNYAKSGSHCRHNVNVWRGGTLLGVGASAAGFDGIDRYTYCADTEAFIAGAEPEIDRITPVQRKLEIFAVNLRTSRGWKKCDWENIYPGSWEKMYLCCRRAAAENPAWWRVEKDNIALTEAGLLFWDDAAGEVLDWEEDWVDL